MQTNLDELLIEANDLVKRLSYDESVDLINNTQTVIIAVSYTHLTLPTILRV